MFFYIFNKQINIIHYNIFIINVSTIGYLSYFKLYPILILFITKVISQKKGFNNIMQS